MLSPHEKVILTQFKPSQSTFMEPRYVFPLDYFSVKILTKLGKSQIVLPSSNIETAGFVQQKVDVKASSDL